MYQAASNDKNLDANNAENEEGFESLESSDRYILELPNDMDQYYIIASILLLINAVHTYIIGHEAKSTDVRFAESYRIFDGATIFEVATTSFADIVSHLERGEYFFLVPVRIGDDSYVSFLAEIVRISPLRRNESRHLSVADRVLHEERVGTWGIRSIAIFGGSQFTEHEFTCFYETAHCKQYWQCLTNISGWDTWLSAHICGYMP